MKIALKKRPEAVTTSTSPAVLRPGHTFLDVVDQACRTGRRYTLTAESGVERFTVLIDRGGPFNASGAGRVGSPALKAAAPLSSGTYLLREGWPVDQPLYQIGLDVTLRELLTGTLRPELEFPAPRGVDALRRGGSEHPVKLHALPPGPEFAPAAPAAEVVPPGDLPGSVTLVWPEASQRASARACRRLS